MSICQAKKNIFLLKKTLFPFCSLWTTREEVSDTLRATSHHHQQLISSHPPKGWRKLADSFIRHLSAVYITGESSLPWARPQQIETKVHTAWFPRLVATFICPVRKQGALSKQSFCLEATSTHGSNDRATWDVELTVMSPPQLLRYCSWNLLQPRIGFRWSQCRSSS